MSVGACISRRLVDCFTFLTPNQLCKLVFYAQSTGTVISGQKSPAYVIGTKHSIQSIVYSTKSGP